MAEALCEVSDKLVTIFNIFICAFNVLARLFTGFVETATPGSGDSNDR